MSTDDDRPSSVGRQDAFGLERPNPPDVAPEDVGRWVGRLRDVLLGADIESVNFRPGECEPLVSFDLPPGEQEVERYWLNAPYSMAVIAHDPEEYQHYYHVLEPGLSAFERTLLQRLYTEVREPILYRAADGGDPEDVIKQELRRRLEEYGLDVRTESLHALFYYLYRDYRGYGKIDPLMYDPHVEDISCNGYGLPLYVYHEGYTDIESDISFRKEELDAFIIQLTQRSQRHISTGEPVVETTLPNGSRIELAFGEQVTPRGSAFTIRRYAATPLTPVDLVSNGTFSVQQMAYLWLAIEGNRNLVFAGGTASGKTTSMNAISMFIPPRSKVLTIEDTRELTLHHDNWLSSLTRENVGEGTDLTMFDLLRSGLRHRPEYIIVGEIRGEEALTLFQAMNTGHTTYSTMHADSVQTAINRLENEPINIPRQMVQSLDILCVQHLTRQGGERARRNKLLAEIDEVDQRSGDLRYSELFEWDAATDSFSEQITTSSVLREISDERGWSQTELRTELRNRRRVLEYLMDNDVTDYRRFTATVNEYFTAPDRVLRKIGVVQEAPSADD